MVLITGIADICLFFDQARKKTVNIPRTKKAPLKRKAKVIAVAIVERKYFFLVNSNHADTW